MLHQLRMSSKQQLKLKFFVCLGKTPTKAPKMLQQVYGDDMMVRTWLFEWHRRFKEDLKDNHRSRRPPSSRTNKNVEHVRAVFRLRCEICEI